MELFGRRSKWLSLVNINMSCYDIGTTNNPRPYVSEKIPALGGTGGGGGKAGNPSFQPPTPMKMSFLVESGKKAQSNQQC